MINLNAGTYTIQFRSNNYGYKTISAVVKKSTPVLKASKKTFKLKVKTKKYKVTFNLPKRYLSGYKLTLKVKGKTYKATTNSRGQGKREHSRQPLSSQVMQTSTGSPKP